MARGRTERAVIDESTQFFSHSWPHATFRRVTLRYIGWSALDAFDDGQTHSDVFTSFGVRALRAVLNTPHRVVDHPDDHPVTGAILVEQRRCRHRVESLPDARRADPRSRRSRPSGSRAAVRPRSGASPAIGLGSITSHGSRSAAEHVLEVQVAVDHHRVGRRVGHEVAAQRTRLLHHPPRDRARWPAAWSGRRSTGRCRTTASAAAASAGMCKPGIEASGDLARLDHVDAVEVALVQPLQQHHGPGGSARYISTVPLPCQACRPRCSCSCSSCGHANRSTAGRPEPRGPGSPGR